MKGQVLPLFEMAKEDSTHIMYLCVWEDIVGWVGEQDRNEKDDDSQGHTREVCFEIVPKDT